ncbi:unnamed protein product, partial [Ectocarpus sp. 12 AP-2014]
FHFEPTTRFAERQTKSLRYSVYLPFFLRQPSKYRLENTKRNEQVSPRQPPPPPPPSSPTEKTREMSKRSCRRSGSTPGRKTSHVCCLPYHLSTVCLFLSLTSCYVRPGPFLSSLLFILFSFSLLFPCFF